MKYLQGGPSGYTTPLNVPVRQASNMTIYVLKLSSAFTKCYVLYPNIPIDEDHIVCILRLRRLVNRQAGFKFLSFVDDNVSTEQCTATFDMHVVLTIGYPYCIVFD